MLIPFPTAFLAGTFLFGLLSFFTGKDDLWQAARYMEAAGIISALIAAIPGIIDFRYTVPPDSSAKKRAAKHGIINTGMLLVFITAFLIRADEISLWVILLEGIGMAMLVVAGWMGGTLVHRNQIGVFNRYADSGKYQEAYAVVKDGIVEAGDVNELKNDQMKLILTGEKRIVLGKTEGEYVAFDDRCSHKGGSLAAGVLICKTVQCPWHGSQFCVKDGSVKAGPAKEKINTYTVMEKEGKLYIKI